MDAIEAAKKRRRIDRRGACDDGTAWTRLFAIGGAGVREGVVRWLAARDRASLLRATLGARDPNLAELVRCIRKHQVAFSAYRAWRARPFAADASVRVLVPGLQVPASGYDEAPRILDLGTIRVVVERLYRDAPNGSKCGIAVHANDGLNAVKIGRAIARDTARHIAQTRWDPRAPDWEIYDERIREHAASAHTLIREANGEHHKFVFETDTRNEWVLAHVGKWIFRGPVILGLDLIQVIPKRITADFGPVLS